jgi:hypothetical protein
VWRRRGVRGVGEQRGVWRRGEGMELGWLGQLPQEQRLGQRHLKGGDEEEKRYERGLGRRRRTWVSWKGEGQ